MFESTFQILAERPVAIAPLLFVLWIALGALWRGRSHVVTIVKWGALGLGIPLFVVLFLAEFTDRLTWHERADALIAFQADALSLLFRFVDAVVAAFLRVFLLFLGGIVTVFEEIASDAVPTVTANEFIITLFLFEFFAGALLVYVLYEATRSSGTWYGSWSAGLGLILFVSGWFSLLLRTGAWEASEATLLSGFVAATAGLALGVTTMLLFVRPDFEGESVRVRLRETAVGELFLGSKPEEESRRVGDAEERGERL